MTEEQIKEFNEAMDSDLRHIHGYVEVVYSEKNGEYNVDTIPTPSILSKSNGQDIIDGERKMIKYGTLENNYLLLDGSFMLYNINTPHNAKGFISENIFSEIVNNKIDIISENDGEVTTGGFTIYFEDNIPFSFTINIKDGNNNVSTYNIDNNTKSHYQFIFENEITIKEFSLVINDVEYSNRRIRIADIDFSISDLYEGDELINYDVNEEMDFNCESIPIGTCDVTLGNYPDNNGNIKFDIMNPTGIVPYLTDNVIIKPYIGVETEHYGLLYKSLGTFFLKNYDLNSEDSVKFHGENIIGKYINYEIPSDGNFLEHNISGGSPYAYFSNVTGETITADIGIPYYINNFYLQDINMINYIKAELLVNNAFKYDGSDDITKAILVVDRDNAIVITTVQDNISVGTINRNQMLSNPVFDVITPINKVEINDISQHIVSSVTNDENILNDTYTLKSNEEYVWYKYGSYSIGNKFSYTTSGSGKAELIDRNTHLAYVKFTGSPGDVFNITYKGSVYNEPSTKKYIYTNDLEKGDTLSLDISQYFDIQQSYFKTVAEYYLQNNYKYKISIKTQGNPSYNLADTIDVNTRYSDEPKKMIITKQHFTYDGGLSCDIEGIAK